MSFLNMAWLGALIPLIAVPLAVHIFNKKFPKKVNFPDVTMIKASLEQRSKLFRLRHIILMILRTLALILLLLCFLQPLMSKFGSDGNRSEGGRNIVVVLDNSLSMSYTGGAISSRQRALTEIEKLIDSVSNEDNINLVVAEKELKSCFDKPSANHSELLAYARGLSKSLTSGDIGRAARLANKQLKDTKNSEIYLISDFQRSSWGKVDLSFIKESRLFYINVAPDIHDNRAITGIKIHEAVILAGSTVPVDIEIANYSEKEMTDRLEIRINEKESLFYDITIAPWNVREVRVEIPLRRRGTHQVKAIISPDDLPEDNSFFFSLKAQDKEEVVIVSDSDVDRTSSNFILESALNPFRNKSGTLLPKVITSASLAPMHLATAGKVFMTGIERLNPEPARLLANFMNKGGSVVYFVDSPNDQYNLQVLRKELTVDLPFIPGRLLTADNIPGGRVKLRSGQFRSKYLALFRGEAKKRLAALDFYEYHQARVTASGQVLLSYSEGTPAMASCAVGLGQLLLCNFSIRETGSNIASQKVFPAWIHEITRNLSMESKKVELYETGDRLQEEIWMDEMRSNSFIDPAGNRMKVKSKVINDKRLLVSFIPASPGHYSLNKNQVTLYSFAVNCNPEESDLRPMDLDQLQTSSDAQTFKVEGKEQYEELKAGQKVFHWFLLACITLMFCELFLFQLFRRLSA